MMDDIGDVLGQNDGYVMSCKGKVVNGTVVLVPDVGTTEFSKYMGAYHQYGEAINDSVEHIAIFAYPFMGHARVSFHMKNEFYNNDPFYFMLMTTEREDEIKNAINKGHNPTINFETQPSNKETDFNV